ncbi:MAG: LysR family transcriptional regulator, partial [Bradyrhizobium sp.]|nr:LysR family transcriptional regulator [Bradyrhizobium sp.]
VGSPLFERNARGLTLTTVGEMLARHVMNVLQDLDRFRSDVASLSGTWHGTVSIACIESLTESVLPDLIASHRGRARRVSFTTEVKGSSDVLEALSRGEADIGIAMALRHPQDLRQVALKRFRLGAVVSHEHPLARRKTVTLTQCLAFPVIHALPELSIYHLLQPLIAQLSDTPEPAIQVNSIDLMRELAARGVGVAFQTQLGIDRLSRDSRLVFLPLDNAGSPVWSDLGIYVRAERTLPAHTESFLQELVRELGERERRENAAHPQIA